MTTAPTVDRRKALWAGSRETPPPGGPSPDFAGCALDDRYELHALIGEGAFGCVYRGLDRRLARAVAVKVIKPCWAQDAAWVERFQREAQLLARVNAPGIVQIFDVGHAREGPYYVAELIDGESLAQRLQRGPLPVARARDVAEQLSRALASAHAKGIVHCDVKPANVLLTAYAQVKVGDFGVARLAQANSQGPSATAAGTPRYMSPEQAQGQPMTPASDVYSVGVVLYEMLAGEPPFARGTGTEVGQRHVRARPPALPARIPRPLRAVVERALEKDPSRRYRNGAEMARALRVIQEPKRFSRTAETIDMASGEGSIVARTLPLQDRTAVLSSPPHAARPPARRRPGRPAGRVDPRRGLILATLIVLLAAASASVAILGSGVSRTTVPAFRGLQRGSVAARASRLHLRPMFLTGYSPAPAGVAVAQQPPAGTRVAEGSTVRVLLSAGPRPVRVPNVLETSSASAEGLLSASHLRYRLTPVVAPGDTPGIVTRQSPAPEKISPSGSTVLLAVAEWPRWRTLTTFAGINEGHSVPFHILTKSWRINYSMAYQGTCLLLFVCFGPSVEAQNVQSGAVESFKLEEAESKTHTFKSGPGLFQLEVSGGEDSARWTMSAEDYY
jgi:eukaryotic-like serine/threonine-protein kinase